jgi:glutaredoxin
VSGDAARVIVTLYTREGCHLCDEAKAAIVPIIARHHAELREIDIDDDAELRAMYNDSVPVIFVGADFFSRYRVDAQKFEKALQAAERKPTNGD